MKRAKLRGSLAGKADAFVRRYFPGVDADTASRILWNATAYPFAGPFHLMQQLHKARRASRGDWRRAIAQAHERLDREMERARQ